MTTETDPETGENHSPSGVRRLLGLFSRWFETFTVLLSSRSIGFGIAKRIDSSKNLLCRLPVLIF